MKTRCYIENTKIAGGFFGGFSYITAFPECFTFFSDSQSTALSQAHILRLDSKTDSVVLNNTYLKYFF